jgi:gliding motility-associated-like protein
MEELRDLRLHNTLLSGPIPESLYSIDSLFNIFIGETAISGGISESIVNLPLINLGLDNNELTGTLPDIWGQFPNMTGLFDISGNQFEGAIPPSLGSLTSVNQFTIDNNNFSGCIPEELLDLCFLSNQQINEGCNDGLRGCQYDFRNNPLLPWQGDFERFCSGEEQVGAPCDDGDATTIDDQINEDCECRGCPNVDVSIVGPEAICDGQVELYSVTGGPYESYDWSTGSNDPELEISVPGDYSVTVTDESGCGAAAMISITATQLNTTIDGPDELCEGDGATLSLSESFSSYDWGDLGNDPTADITGPGIYQLEVIDDQGCVFTTSIDIPEGDDCVDKTVIEKVITPNGDGFNDTFDVGIEDLADNFPSNNLLVFNRWGSIVFESEPYDNDWRGQNSTGQDLPEGTYYVLFRLRGLNNFEFRGSVTVIR